MAGIDNITGQILGEAQNHAAKIMSDAEVEANLIKEKFNKEIDDIKKASLEKSDREVENLALRIRSSIDILRKKSMLFAKQQMIDEVIEKAYERLDGQETGDYFAMITKLLDMSVRPGKGEMYFSARDLARLPSDFEENANRIASSHGGTVVVSKTPGHIVNGFILSYGGIEENCSLRAIFNADQDQLQDISCRVLFS